MSALPEPYFEAPGVTLYHGDALWLLPLLPLASVDAVVTDPPYSSGGAFRGDRTVGTVEKYVSTKTKTVRPEFSGDSRDQRGYLAWSSLWLNAARVACVPGATLSCFTDWRQLPTTTDAVQAGGWIWRGLCPWTKGYGRPMGPGRYSSAAEYVVWGSNGPTRDEGAMPPGSCDVPDEAVLGGAVECLPPREREHVAQKPVEVMTWLLGIVPPHGRVLDCFAGSGTTLLAARQLGLTAIGMECDESACELIARRLEHMPREAEAGQRSLFTEAM